MESLGVGIISRSILFSLASSISGCWQLPLDPELAEGDHSWVIGTHLIRFTLPEGMEGLREQ